jgi:hypothetical protein
VYVNKFNSFVAISRDMAIKINLEVIIVIPKRILKAMKFCI